MESEFEENSRKMPRGGAETDPECTCLICGKAFRASKIEFGEMHIPPEAGKEDTVFAGQLGQYRKAVYDDGHGYRYGIPPLSREMIDRNTWKVLKREANGLPLEVEGKWEGYTGPKLLYVGGIEGIIVDAVTSADRLCPHCHFSLPPGFASDRVLRVGVVGCTSRGRAGYITHAVRFLKDIFGANQRGLELGRVELMEECRSYHEALFRELELETDEPEEEAKPLLPMVMRITPLDEEYPPFFLVLEDIAGFHRPTDCTELLVLADIDEILGYADPEDSPGGRPADLSGLYAGLAELGSGLEEGQLQSVQCVLTGPSLWCEDTTRPPRWAILPVCDYRAFNRKRIDTGRLGRMQAEIMQLLSDADGHDYSDVPDRLFGSLGAAGSGIRTGCSAACFRGDVATEDVLDPLLNLFVWHRLLPAKE